MKKQKQTEHKNRDQTV